MRIHTTGFFGIYPPSPAFAEGTSPLACSQTQNNGGILRKIIAFLIVISMSLLSCGYKEGFHTTIISPTMNSTALYKNSKSPLITPTVGYIERKANDFLPSSTPAPSLSPTNVFSPVVNKSDYDGLVITLERTPCFGKCPVYSVIIYGNGTGIYEGKLHVKTEGVHEFTLQPKQLSKLINAFESAQYFSLDNSYSMAVTDMASILTSITFQGKSKKIYHYGLCRDEQALNAIATLQVKSDHGAPQSLCDLEAKIDEIINTEQWVR